MTLIYSMMGPELGLITISDVLTSTQDKSYSQKVELPLVKDPIKWESERFASFGTAQKAVIFGKTMIMWAGNRHNAELVIRTLRSMSWDGSLPVRLSDALAASGLQGAQLKTIELIYHFRISVIECHREHHRCTEIPSTNGLAIIGGSGRDHFAFELAVEQNGDPVSLEATVREIISRAQYVLLAGILDSHNYVDAYGGWIEITTATATGFTKRPVCIKIWTLSNEGSIRIGLPLFFSTYVGSRLIVTRAVYPNNDFNQTPSLSFVPISDLLGRLPSREAVPQHIGIQKGLMIHNLLNEDGGWQNSLIIESPSPFGIEFYSKNTTLHSRVEGWLTDRLGKMKMNRNATIVRNTYD